MIAHTTPRTLTIEQFDGRLWRQHTTRRLSHETAYRMAWQLAERQPGCAWRVFDDEALEQVGPVVCVREFGDQRKK